MAALNGKARTAETYLAGLGATGALIAGAVMVFLLLVGMVTFDAWPRAAGLFADDEPPVAAVDTSASAESAADALSGAADLVAAADPGASLVDQPGGSGESGGGQGDGTGGGDTGGGGDIGGGQTPPGTTPDEPSQPPSGQGVDDTVNGVTDTVNNTVNGVTNTVNNTVTGLNNTVNNTLNGVNGLLKGLTGQ